MQNIVDSVVKTATDILQLYGPLAGCGLIILESIIPMLPLALFIAFNMFAFGNVWGFIISWASTILGCILSYLLFKYFGKKLDNFITKREKIDRVRKAIKKINYSSLVLLMALPFTPAFLINISAGLSHMKFKKFFSALLLGKVFMVFFWGFVGKSLLESITDIKTIIIVVLLLAVAYILSKLVNKKFNIE